MLHGCKDQVCVVSGESGAGKTEATKYFIKHLTHICHGLEMPGLHHKLVNLNPVLEAFGNAQTLMNDNSSRFGKFTELVFTRDGRIRGATMRQYLLEKSRIIFQNTGEQNFHIFYLFFATTTEDDRFTYSLHPPESYVYLNRNPHALLAIDTPEMTKAGRELLNCLTDVGFTAAEQANIWALLSGILLLGNIDFAEESTVEISGDQQFFQQCCVQLGINEHTLGLALTRSVVIIRGEEMECAYKLSESEDCRNATAKALYDRIFSWVIQRCNQLLGPQSRTVTDLTVGILDIFGFECFEANGFEQICINLANEHLQFFFNEHIFRMEQIEYESEGIVGANITYTDNKQLLDLFFKAKLGLIALLDEEVHVPITSFAFAYATHTNEKLDTERFYAKLLPHAFLSLPAYA